MRRNSLGWLFVGFAAVVVLLSPGAPAAASGKVCATAEIDEFFVLPDGSLHAPGILKLCRDTDFTPATTLHWSFVNNMPVGMLFGRIGASESGESERPFLLFVRGAAGRLHLSGYALPCRDGMETFRLERPRGGKKGRVITTTLTAARNPLPEIETPRDEPVIVVAANRG